MYDSEANKKAGLNAAARKWRAEKYFRRQGRVKSEAAFEDNNYAKQMLREEIEADEDATDAGPRSG